MAVRRKTRSIMHKRKIKRKRNKMFIHLNMFACFLIAIFIYKGISFEAFIINKCISFESFIINKGIYIVLILCIVVFIFILKIYFNYHEKSKYLKSGIREVDKMRGIEFETFLMFHFQKLGYKTVTTSVTGDYGADLVLKKDFKKIIVQAKRYYKKVGIKAIQEVYTAVGYYKADKGYVITNNYFTKPAIRLAEANGIELWDRKKLINIMTKENLQENIKIIKQEEEQKVEINICPWCGDNLIKRRGKNGSFLGCKAYPKCKYTNSIKN